MSINRPPSCRPGCPCDEARAPSQYKDGLSSYGIPVLKIRRSRDHLIFIMGIPILVRRYLYTETTAWPFSANRSDIERGCGYGSMKYFSAVLETWVTFFSNKMKLFMISSFILCCINRRMQLRGPDAGGSIRRRYKNNVCQITNGNGVLSIYFLKLNSSLH